MSARTISRKPLDFAKIGLLLANNGTYITEKVIDEKYINEVIKPCKQYPGYGMLWWIDYEKTVSVVDDEILNELKKAGTPNKFLHAATKMKGTYNTNEEYYAKIQSVFGENPWGYINETLGSNLRLRKKIFSGNITYRADGYLGNYIIVNPQNNVVAIRMISHQSFESENDNFNEFSNLVLDLTK